MGGRRAWSGCGSGRPDDDAGGGHDRLGLGDGVLAEVEDRGGQDGVGTSVGDAVGWAQGAQTLGAGEILLTSMDRDGTRDGFELTLTALVADAVTIPVIASGGVGTLDHLVDGVTEGHADAVLAASIFHFGEHTVAEAKAAMAAAGVTVRPA